MAVPVAKLGVVLVSLAATSFRGSDTAGATGVGSDYATRGISWLALALALHSTLHLLSGFLSAGSRSKSLLWPQGSQGTSEDVPILDTSAFEKLFPHCQFPPLSHSC